MKPVHRPDKTSRTAKVAAFKINPFGRYYIYFWIITPPALAFAIMAGLSTREFLPLFQFVLIVFFVPPLILMPKQWKVEIDDRGIRLWELGVGLEKYPFNLYDFRFERQKVHLGKWGWHEGCSITNRETGTKVRILAHYCFFRSSDLKEQLLLRQSAFWSNREMPPSALPLPPAWREPDTMP